MRYINHNTLVWFVGSRINNILCGIDYSVGKIFDMGSATVQNGFISKSAQGTIFIFFTGQIQDIRSLLKEHY